MNRAALSRLLGSTRARLVAVLALATVVIGVLAVQAADSSLSYYVTPEGFEEKSRLVARYLDTSLAFFRKVRQEYRQLFVDGQKEGHRRFVLVGRGEVAEIALLAAIEADAELVGILDCEADANRLHGLPVLRSLDEAEAWDALVITESRHPQEAFDRLRDTAPAERVLAPPFLRIVREPLDFTPPAVEPAGGRR